MAKFVRVGTQADFANPQGGKLVQAEGHSVAIFKVGGSYYAIDNTCTHRGGPLADGTLAGDVVTCPWHGAQYNVKTGAVLSPPAPQGVRSFPVRLTGNDVEVDVE